MPHPFGNLRKDSEPWQSRVSSPVCVGMVGTCCRRCAKKKKKKKKKKKITPAIPVFSIPQQGDYCIFNMVRKGFPKEPSECGLCLEEGWRTWMLGTADRQTSSFPVAYTVLKDLV